MQLYLEYSFKRNDISTSKLFKVDLKMYICTLLLKIMSNDAIFLATCNIILFYVKLANTHVHCVLLMYSSHKNFPDSSFS